MSKEKIVYILGAGASKTANLPIQSEILQLIYDIEEDAISTEVDILNISIDANVQGLMNYYSIFDQYRRDLGKFIISNFSSKENILKYNTLINSADDIPSSDFALEVQRKAIFKKAYELIVEIDISLEDLFTIFDNVQIRHEHFKMYTNKDIAEYNRKLKLCIVYALIYTTVKNSNSNTYMDFANKLFEKRKHSALKDDNFTVITMNWDSLFEHILNDICLSYNKSLSPHKQKILPDLCFYNDTLTNNSSHLPFTNIKAKGIKNIKILKMHGSLSWLECPKCGRVFTDFNKEIANDEFNNIVCPFCSNEDITPNQTFPRLQCMIITPTFLKSLDNLIIKNIWHNAYIELNEATKIVFIGYSFPEADFEMRCLLKKAIKNETAIEVVLHYSDNPHFYYKKFLDQGLNEDEATQFINKMQLPEKRYKSFFGDTNVTFYYDGFSNYVNKI